MPRNDERDLFGFRKPATFDGPVPPQQNPAGGPRIRPTVKANRPELKPDAVTGAARNIGRPHIPQGPQVPANARLPSAAPDLSALKREASKFATPASTGATLRRGLDANVKFVKDNVGGALSGTKRALGDLVGGFMGTQQTAQPAQGGYSVVDIGGTKRYFPNEQDAMRAAVELDQAPQAQDPAINPAARPDVQQPRQVTAASDPGGQTIIRGAQAFTRGADGVERIKGISDPRLAELMAARDSMIRNRPHNAFNPSSVPSPEASMQSADRVFSDALGFISEGDKQAAELQKARIAASTGGSDTGLKGKDLLVDSQKAADRRLDILEAMGIAPDEFAGFLRSALGAEQDPERRERLASGDLTDQELMNIGAALKLRKNRNTFSFKPWKWFDDLTAQQAYTMGQNGGIDY